MQTFFQWVIIVCLVGTFFLNVYRDFNGRPAQEPKGYEGFVISCIATAIAVTIYYFAGAFSALFGS